MFSFFAFELTPPLLFSMARKMCSYVIYWNILREYCRVPALCLAPFDIQVEHSPNSADNYAGRVAVTLNLLELYSAEHGE